MLKWMMVLVAAPALFGQSQAAIEKAVLEVSAQMTQAGENRDADALFRHMLEMDRGSVIQNGNLMLTREQALAQVKANIGAAAKVEYRWKRQMVTVISPSSALLVAEGESVLTTQDGQTLVIPLAQTLVFVRSAGEWKVLHAHQSSPVRR